MLENIKSILQNYVEIKEYFNVITQKESDKLESLVNQGLLTNFESHQDFNIFKERLNKLDKKINDQYITAITDYFEKLKQQIDEHIQESVPNGFYDTLSSLKTIKDSLSKEEFNTHIEIYRNNYLAMRTLRNEFPSMFDKAEARVVTYDSLIEEHKNTLRELNKWFNEFNMMNYHTRLLLSDKNVITGFDDSLKIFFNKNKLDIDFVSLPTKSDIESEKLI